MDSNNNTEELNDKSDINRILQQLDQWIESSDKNSIEFGKFDMASMARQYKDHSQAYWNVKQFILVNFIENQADGI